MRFANITKEKYNKVEDLVTRAIMLNMLEGIQLEVDDINAMIDWTALDEDDFFDILRILRKFYGIAEEEVEE